MIILHFDLQLQFKYMNYFIYTSHHFTPHGRYQLNELTSLPMCGFIAQLVEHRTGIAEVTGSNPVEALILFCFFFFRLLLSNCLNWTIYCDDHSSLCFWFCLSVCLLSLFAFSYLAGFFGPLAKFTTFRQALFFRGLWLSRFSER